VLSARLARADEDRQRGEERAAGEARRVQGLLDRAREEAVRGVAVAGWQWYCWMGNVVASILVVDSLGLDGY
jgi:hypothetical protein